MAACDVVVRGFLVGGVLAGSGVVLAETVIAPPLSASRETSRVVTGPVRAGVFRSEGENGEVEFNNFGNGERVALEVVPPASAIERARVAERTQALFDVAQALSGERILRERDRAARRETRLASARAEAREEARRAAWVDATQPRYYPINYPRRHSGYEWDAGFGPGFQNPGLQPSEPPPKVDPYLERFRYPWRPVTSD